MTTLRCCILLIIISIGQSHVYDTCYFNKHCRCWTNDFLHVDCSGKAMTTIPRFPSNVSFLNIQCNLIQNIKPGIFDNLKILQKLDLSYNNLTRLPQGAFIGLNNLHILILEYNNLNYSIQSFPRGVFKPLVSLKHLNIKFNYKLIMQNFPDDVISDLKELNTLEVDAFDAFPVKGFGKGFSQLVKLTQLITGACIMFTVNNKTFENLQYLEYIDVNGCVINTYEYCTLCNRKRLKYLDFSNILLERENIICLTDDLKSSTIDTLLLTNTSHYLSSAPVTFINNMYRSGIRELYLNKNHYVEVDYFKYDPPPPTLSILDMSDNKLTSFEFDILYFSKLNLQNNTLGRFLSSHVYMASSRTNLKEINLSFNGIFELAPSMFHNHPNLQLINVSNNLLTGIAFDLPDDMPLQTLDLSYNKIRVIDKATMDVIDKLARKSKLMINLSNNDLQCDCQAIYFLQWMVKNEEYFSDRNIYKCMFQNGTIITLHPMKDIVTQLQKQCESYTVLIVGISIAIVTSCIVLIGGLVYRYRWKLRYMYYMTRSRYYRYHPVATDDEFVYNAFISYCESDTDFVVKECIANLEHNGNAKLCIHRRDFLPGEEITVNITNAIHESKKTICIITREFLKSYYCMFEFNMARMESIYSRNGENILFLVFYEQILPRELPLVMLELVQQQSYIEYPNDEQGNVVFWDKIKNTIG